MPLGAPLPALPPTQWCHTPVSVWHDLSLAFLYLSWLILTASLFSSDELFDYSHQPIYDQAALIRGRHTPITMVGVGTKSGIRDGGRATGTQSQVRHQYG